MEAQAARAQRKAETYRRRMAALGQPVPPAEQMPAYVSPFQQPMQGMYQDPYVAPQGYNGAVYAQAPVYQDFSGGMYAGNSPAAGALQWEMPQAVMTGRRSGQPRHMAKPQFQADSNLDLGYPAEQGYQASRLVEVPHKGAHHGRRSGASPNRHRVTGAAAETLDRLPTVKEMHLQRVATMAAAAATAQQISADVESHEQFAKELRSYRGQAAGGGARRVTKPTWESDVGEGGAFEAGYPPSGHESPAYDGAPGELMWQTSGRPHQLHIAPAPKQSPPSGPKKKEGVIRRRKDPSSEQPSPSGAWSDMQPSAAGFSDPQDRGTPPGPDPPDMPGINRAGLLNLRNKLRGRSALMSPPTPAFSAAISPSAPQPGTRLTPDRLGNQENLAGPYASASPSASPAVKQPRQEPLARRRVLPTRQEPPPFRLGSDGASSSSSSSSSSSFSSSAGAGAPPARAGQRRASGQGTQGPGPRAAAQSRTSNDNQGEANQIGDPNQPARPSGDASSLGMAASPGDLTQCEGCGRSFNPKAFEVHSRICAKIFQTKRKAFNVAEARLADTGAEQFYDARRGAPKAEAGAIGSSRPGRKAARGGLVRGGSGGAAPTHADKPVGVGGKAGAKWRNQSDQLRIAMAASKGGSQATVTAFGGAAIASAPDPSLILCPHCGRRFNETAAERHIPKCQDIRAKPNRLMAGAGQKRQPASSPISRGWG